MLAWIIAVAALAGALALRMALDPYLVDSVSFVTLFGAVAVAVWMVGPRVAIGFACVGYLACHYLFAEPREDLFFGDLRTAVAALAYAVTCWLIIAIGEAMRSAEAFAQARGELLRVTLASIGDAVIATDVESRITYVNESAEMLTGWSCMEALGHPLHTVFRLIDSDDGSSIAAAMQAPDARRRSASAQRAVLLGRDTLSRLVEHSVAPIKGSDGLIAGCVVTFRDISEKQRFEREQADRERASRLLAAVVGSCDDAIVGASLDGAVTTWSASAERMFGYSAAEMIGEPVARIIPTDRCAQEEALIATTLKDGHRVESFETERVHKSGRRAAVSLVVSPVMDSAGRVVGALHRVRDTSRQRAIAQRERALLRATAAANERLHAFLDQCAVFAALMQPSGTVLESSRLSWESCGYRREQIVGKAFWEGPWWARSPILVERIRQACEQAARGDAFRADVPYFARDGGERLADVSIVGMRNGEGRMLLLAATAVDITDRKRAEDERQRLATLVENSTDFIGTYGLDFMPIEINPAGLALVGLESIEDARRHHIQDFFAPEDRQRIMGEFFATVMREGHGATEVRLRHFKTGELRWMQYKVLTLRDTFDRRTGYATVSRDITESRMHAERLRSPAAKRANDAHPERAAAAFSHELRNLLSPLTHAVDIVRRAAGDHRTTLTAVDAIERQTARIVRLVEDRLEPGGVAPDEPQHDSPPAEAPIAASACAQKPSRRVLVVDDNRDAAATLAMLLQMDGHPTFVAHDGFEALAAAEKHRPDVVLLDIGMPVLSGYEVCRRLRDQSYGKQMLILALTGWGQDSDRRRTREAGFDGHYVKPANYRSLAAALQSGVVRGADRRGAC